MAIRSNITDDIATGCYHARPFDCFRRFHRRGTSDRRWTICRFRQRSPPQECSPAPGCLSVFSAGPAGCSLAPVAAKPSDAEVHAWLWNVAGHDKGTRASPRTVLGSIVRLRSLLVYSFTVWCSSFACGGTTLPVTETRTKTEDCKYALSDV